MNMNIYIMNILYILWLNYIKYANVFFLIEFFLYIVEANRMLTDFIPKLLYLTFLAQSCSNAFQKN